jgi:hypothetical protein
VWPPIQIVSRIPANFSPNLIPTALTITVELLVVVRFVIMCFIRMNLDGPVKITTSDGDSRIINSGEVFFVEDIEGKVLHHKFMNFSE